MMLKNIASMLYLHRYALCHLWCNIIVVKKALKPLKIGVFESNHGFVLCQILGYLADGSQDSRLTFLLAATQGQSEETMTSVLAAYFILTPTQPIGSLRPD